MTVASAPRRQLARAAGNPAARAVAPVVDIQDLHRRFGPVTVLRGVDLHVQPGDIHALIGPNGAGKTTLLRAIAGLGRPTAGHVSVLGGPPGRRAVRADVGWMPSGDRTFYLRLSGYENLLFFGRLYGLRRRGAALAATRALEAVDLTAAARRPVHTYSHGMEKRLSLARALMLDPPLLLLDEPAHDLDPAAAEAVRTLVRSAAERGTATIWATQRLEELPGFATRVSVLVDGQVRYSGEVDNFVAVATPRTFLVRTSASFNTVQAAVDGQVVRCEPARDGAVLVELSAGRVIGELVADLHACGVQVQSCELERSPVLDAFDVVTGGGAS